MAIIIKEVVSDGGDQNVYTTGVVSFDPYHAAYIMVSAARLGTNGWPETPVLSGGGMTSWSQAAGVGGQYSSGTGSHRGEYFLFHAQQAVPGAAAAITIDFPGSGNRTGCDWIIFAVTNCPIGGNGLAPIVQIKNDADDANDGATSSAPTVDAFAYAGNITLWLNAVRDATPNYVPPSGFTVIGHIDNGGSPALSNFAYYRVGQFQPIATHDSQEWGATIIEIAQPPASGSLASEGVGPSVGLSRARLAA
jgi:hypothetical protein